MAKNPSRVASLLSPQKADFGRSEPVSLSRSQCAYLLYGCCGGSATSLGLTALESDEAPGLSNPEPPSDMRLYKLRMELP